MNAAIEVGYSSKDAISLHPSVASLGFIGAPFGSLPLPAIQLKPWVPTW